MFLMYMLESDSGEINTRIQLNMLSISGKLFFDMLRDGILSSLCVLNRVLQLSFFLYVIGSLTQNSVYVYSIIYFKSNE